MAQRCCCCCLLGLERCCCCCIIWLAVGGMRVITNRLKQQRRTLSWVVFHTLALTIAAIFVMPLLWVVAASLRQPGLPPPRTIEWLPSPIAWGNYWRIFQLVPFA